LSVSKALTTPRHAVCRMTKVVESHRYRSLHKQFAHKPKSAPRSRRAFAAYDGALSGRGDVGSRMFVQRRDPRSWRSSVALRMLRSGDNRLQIVVLDALLPNYWAKCLLMQQRLLVLGVAEVRSVGAQW
jgi:hypothetical protein